VPLTLANFREALSQAPFLRYGLNTFGLGNFGTPESGADWSIITAATLMSVTPKLIAFLLFQRQKIP
jgi:ABC-type glycerol-3-phosphate transport system permease component